MHIHRFTAGPRIRGLAIVTAVAVVISGASVSDAAAADDSVAQTPGATAPDPVGDGASSNEAAIAAAADSFDASDPGTAVELSGVASAADEVPLQAVPGGLEGTDAAGGQVTLSGEGATLAMAGQSYGLAPLGGSGDSTVVDDAVVHEDVAPSTDVVTRAIDGGVQMTAVLADASAPDSVDFGVDLPQGASLSPNADGTISVIAPVETVEPLPGEAARIDAAVSAVLGDVEDGAAITDAQQAALDAIPPAATTTTVEPRDVATIGAAWAVDANGQAVATHYEIDGTTLTQVVETDARTAYPVVADPSWFWWAWTAASCVANLATIVFVAAKLVNLASRLSSIANRSAALMTLVNKIGGARNLVMGIYDMAKGWAQGNVMKYLTRTQYALISGASSSVMALIGDWLGIGSCVSLLREI